MIWQSEDIKIAAIAEDPNVAAEAFLRGVNTILDTLAPQKRVQIKSNQTPYLSEATGELQKKRDSAMNTARETNHPVDWRNYRLLRNRGTQSLRNDNFAHIKKVSSLNTSLKWKAVNQLTGGKPKGPPPFHSFPGFSYYLSTKNGKYFEPVFNKQSYKNTAKYSQNCSGPSSWL